MVALVVSVTRGMAALSDFSNEAVVIQNLATQVSFASDGAREWKQTLSVRVQSEAAVRQYGILAFAYSSPQEQIKIDYVRVKKADGSIVETPASNFIDLATQIATLAPTYSDLRQKQVPVMALGVGDVLEYSVRTVQQKPELPGHFWYIQHLADEGIVLNQTLEISVPKAKYVQVSSPKLKPEVRDEADRRVYLWKHSHLESTKPVDTEQADNSKPAAESEPLTVQLTTFRNWEEVGTWWSNLAERESQVTPAIEAKARQLTAGLSSDKEKQQAIYKYVSLRFRYISISFGAGRYRPHSAADVLANQYGDCKDKHTLLVSLMKAVGIEAWPALIGVGSKFDDSVPSPAQFNHVITVLPENGKYLWLDTTAEVAPFGLLAQGLRDEQALLIPPATGSRGRPQLVKTPMDPPFTASESINVKAEIGTDGTLKGNFSFELTGDSALVLRAAFRQLAPAQWQAFAQQFSYSLNFSGDVTSVTLESLEDIDKPLRLRYEYVRKNYPGWEERRITPPLPNLSFGPGDKADKPKNPFWMAARGVTGYQATLKAPKGFTIELPQDVSMTNDFSDYSSHYAFKDGMLVASRKITIKKAKVTGENWKAYQQFSKSLQTDQAALFSFTESGTVQRAATAGNHPGLDQLINRAAEAWKQGKMNEAGDLLRQVEQVNPKQPKLWAMRGAIEMNSQNVDQGISYFRKEIQFHPEEISAYQALSGVLLYYGRQSEAIGLWRSALTSNPNNEIAATQMAELSLVAKQYSEIPGILEKPIAAAPTNYHLQAMRVDALLRSGQKALGIAEARKIIQATPQPVMLNDLAYSLCDTETEVNLAQQLAERFVNQTEQDCEKISLANLNPQDLENMNLLAAGWDTLGWVYFKQGDLAKAEKYLDSAWRLSQYADVADHLGQVYNKQGKRRASIHMWRLALASDSKHEGAKQNLKKAGAPIAEPMPLAKKPHNALPVSASQELGELRTIKLPSLPKQTGSAEFFVVYSKTKIEDVQFISGPESFRSAIEAIRNIKSDFALPDAGPEQIVRRGILSCSEYTAPSCSFTMLLPSTTRVAWIPGRNTESENAPLKSEAQ